MGSMLGFWIGAAIGAYLVSRIIRAVFLRKMAGQRKIVVGYALTLAAATIMGGFGMADGGPPQFFEALAGYAIPVLALVGVETILWRRKSRQPVPVLE